MPNRLEGANAVVTGACSGIGLGIAEAYVDEGARVAILDVQTDEFDAVESRLDGEVLTVECDVRDSESVRAAVEDVRDAWGGIDVVVNNAGVVVRNSVGDLEDEEMDFVLDVDLKGVMRIARETMPALRESNGAMVNITSAVAEGGVAGLSAYTAAKSGVAGLTRQLAAEYGPDGVRVNSIAPGTAKTPVNAGVREDNPEWAEEIAEKVPLGRLATPEDITGPAVFLAAEESSYITGESILVDGGRTAQSR